ncbi:hypothetical protein [Colwellia psychrerythraea]|uniref:Heparinase II/III family protein n=1 Tax=Colwellia psychrerythraea TaxID=28229 RepID=A0A099L3Q4_COLPS|nr:hypothetical protein [Colwellia psychrerythraea]KGJ96782.1 Heparinase II/III family protein [Colwellia psychrerythraea]
MSIRRFYFITIGIASHLSIYFIVLLLSKHYDLTPGQFFYQISEELGIQSPSFENVLFNNSFTFPAHFHIAPRFTNNVRLLAQTNKILAGQLSISDFQSDYLRKNPPCKKDELLALVTCSLFTKDPEFVKQAKQALMDFKVVQPNSSGRYANSWRLAFAYDSLKHMTDFSRQDKIKINNKLSQALKHYLILLNGKEASLWHGRTTLTAQMWITILAIDGIDETLLNNAMPHFYNMVEALELTEAWPEGYNYWINSRAFYVVLALSGYLNGTEKDRWHIKIKSLINKLGHWHIQATRPDWKIEPLGDEGPRLDLKDESRRVIDIIAQITRNPIFTQYSNKMSKLHGIESYHAPYRWGLPLFYPIDLPDRAVQPLSLMEIFGQNSLGQSYIRQNWQDNSTFISYRAGSSFTHHGHYDNGHVSLFKGAPLLMNSSVPSQFFSENRLNYGIRTIAKNSIIVQRKREEVLIGFNRDNNISDGGQRITLPIGSEVTTIADWHEKSTKTPMLVGGAITSHENHVKYSYIKSDLTKAYNSSWYDDNGRQGKLELVGREVIFLREQDTLLIKDKIRTRDENQVKLVFHTMNKPIVVNEKVLKGQANNGILTSSDKWLKIQNGNGFLTTEILADILDVRLIGGDNYKFYVESDGDDTVLTGKNYSGGLTWQQVSHAPSWRFEVRAKRQVHNEIITVHRPSLKKFRLERTEVKNLDDNIQAYIIGNVAVIFNEKQLSVKNMQQLQGKQVLICGLEQKKSGSCQYHSITGVER